MRADDFHDLLDYIIIWKAWKVETRCQLTECLSSVNYLFVAKEFPIKKGGHYSLNNINDILLKSLVAFIKLLNSKIKGIKFIT